VKEPKSLTVLRKRRDELISEIEKFSGESYKNVAAIYHSRKSLALTEMMLNELEKEFEKAKKLQSYQKPRWEVF